MDLSAVKEEAELCEDGEDEPEASAHDDDDLDSLFSASVAGKGRAGGKAGSKQLTFTTKDYERLKTSLAPAAVKPWVEDFVDALEDYSAKAAALAILSDKQWALQTKGSAAVASLDREIARAALNCFDKESPHVKMVRSALRDERPDARRSGNQLLKFIVQATRSQGGEGARQTWDDFEKKAYFKVGDALEITRVNAASLKDDFEALRAGHHTDEKHALLRWVLRKMPAACTAQKEALEDKLIEALGASRGCTGSLLSAAPWRCHSSSCAHRRRLLHHHASRPDRRGPADDRRAQ